VRIQRKSEGLKYGDTNKDHVEAVKRVISFWNKFGINLWRPIENLEILYTPEFIKRQMMDKDKQKDYYGHTPDIALICELFNHTTGRYTHDIRLIIEIDGESHSSPQKQKNDGVFKDFINEKYDRVVRVIRLQKVECLGQTADVEKYLKDELKGFLK
jgi:hypothetical protein